MTSARRKMQMTDLQRTIIRLLNLPATDKRWHPAYFIAAVQAEFEQRPSTVQVWEALWGLVAQELVFIDPGTQTSSSNWQWALTERGRKVAEGADDYEPYDPEGYLAAIRSRTPDIDDLVMVYAGEALSAFKARCYLASSVMLGVASERAFLLLGEAAADWIGGGEGDNLRDVLRGSRNFLVKFSEFRKRIEPKKRDLPDEFSDSMALDLDAVLDLLRISRNDAGHPTGRILDEGSAYINLQLFARYLEKMMRLRKWLLANTAETSSEER
jgi:hypothetical protein